MDPVVIDGQSVDYEAVGRGLATLVEAHARADAIWDRRPRGQTRRLGDPVSRLCKPSLRMEFDTDGYPRIAFWRGHPAGCISAALNHASVEGVSR